MQLPLPIYKLKRLAKTNSRSDGIPLHAALDQVASQQGYANWSLLARDYQNHTVAKKLLAGLIPGDLVLIAGRPGQGKTLLGIELAAKAAADRHSHFFSLESTESEIADKLIETGNATTIQNQNFRIDVSDAICSHYICTQLCLAPHGTFVVVDYLQILDQRRQTPPLNTQLEELKNLASRKGLIMVLLSQVDRQFDVATKDFPGPEDIRMPNAFDLTAFTKCCFVNNGEVRFHS